MIDRGNFYYESMSGTFLSGGRRTVSFVGGGRRIVSFFTKESEVDLDCGSIEV